MIEKKKCARALVVMVLSLIFSVALFTQLSGSAPKTPPGQVSQVSEASYIVFTDGVLAHAKNGDTGIIELSDTNASKVIQAAIDGLSSDGGTILIREGTYVISSTIRIRGNVTLSGVGFATKLVLADYADQNVIENKHLDAYVDSNIVITNLQIDGNGAKQTRGAQASAIFISRVTKSRIEGNWIHNVAPLSVNAGIEAHYSNGLIIRGNMIYENQYAGVFLLVGTNGLVSDNWVYHNYRGVYLGHHKYGIVEGNQIVSNGEGVRMYVTARYNTIQGNLIKDSSDEGIAITHDSCENNVVLGNYLINNNIQIADNGTGTIIKDNEGYRTENGGMASIVNGTHVSHGLVETPSLVQLTSTAQRVISCISKNDTHIQIGLWFLNGTAVTQYENILWYAQV